MRPGEEGEEIGHSLVGIDGGPRKVTECDRELGGEAGGREMGMGNGALIQHYSLLRTIVQCSLCQWWTGYSNNPTKIASRARVHQKRAVSLQKGKWEHSRDKTEYEVP